MNHIKKIISLLLVITLMISVDYQALAETNPLELTETISSENDYEDSSSSDISYEENEYKENNELTEENISEETNNDEVDKVADNSEELQADLTDPATETEDKELGAPQETATTLDIEETIEEDSVRNVGDKDVVDVNNWSEFEKAYNDQSIKKINLINNLETKDKPNKFNLNERLTSLEIEGNGKQIQNHNTEHVFPLGNSSTEQILKLTNLKIRETDSNIIVNKRGITRWDVLIENSDIDSSNTKAFISGSAFGEVRFNNSSLEENTSVRIKSVPNGTLIFENNSNVIFNGEVNFKIIEVNDSNLSAYNKLSGNYFSSSNANLSGGYLKSIGVGFEFKNEIILHRSKVMIDTNKEVFKTPRLIIKESDVNLKTTQKALSADVGKTDLLFRVENSKVNFYSSNKGHMIEMGTSNTNLIDLYIEFTGPKTEINLESQSSGDQKATVKIIGNNKTQEKPSGIYVNDGAKVQINSQGGHAIMSEIKNGGLTHIEGEGTEFIATQETSAATYGATLRYFLVGNQTFKVSNKAIANIQGGVGDAPTVRMYGDNNSFIAEDGGKIKIYNPGSGASINPGVSGGNQGILYTGTSSDNYFSIKGNSSEIDIIADNGAAIDAKGTMNIIVAENTVFTAVGQTKSENAAVFNASTLKFESERPLFYDFANHRDGGGKLFDTDAKSYYKSTMSDFAVWELGAHLDGNPYKSWSQFSFELSGKNLINIESTDQPNEFNTESFGTEGIANYSRMSGNNAKPIINDMPIPFDTDRYVYGHAAIAEGVDKIRNAWTNEVFVTVEHRDENGKLLERYEDLPTKGMENGDLGYPVYDVAADERGGYFRVDMGENKLAQIGHEFKIVDAYRGSLNISENRHVYAEQDNLPDAVKVIDKTPPEIAYIKGPVFNKQKTISGTSSEKEVYVTIVLDGVPLKDKDGQLLKKKITDGNWEFNLDNVEDLNADQKLHVVLEDMSGNQNPLVETPFHDIIKQEAAHVEVEESFFELKADNLYISLKDFKEIKDDQALITAMNASAIEERENTIVHDVEIADKESLSYQNPEAGTFNVTFVIKDFEMVELQRKVYILPYDKVVETDQYIIVANNFFAGRKDHLKTDQEIIKLAQAKAFKKENMSVDKTVKLEKNTLTSRAGVYPLTFIVKENLSTKVSIAGTVIDKDSVSFNDHYVIGANDFTIMDYIAIDISDDFIIEQSSAQAWLISDWEEVPVKVVGHNVAGNEGRYKAKLGVK